MNDTITFYGNADSLARDEFHFVTADCQHFPEPLMRNTDFSTPEWNFAVILAILVIMVINKLLAPRKFRGMISIFYEGSHTDKVLREWSPLGSATGLTVFVSYIILISLFLQKTLIVFTDNALYYSTLRYFENIFWFVAAFYVFQYLLINFFGWLFQVEANVQRQSTLHLSLMSSYNFALIFMILILSFYPYKFFCVFGIIILFIPFCIRMLRTFIEIQTFSKLNFVNIFLYLCTLEILPLAVVATMGKRFIETGWII